MQNLNGKQILIRADANSKVGSGHVMRCLALAQEWHSRGGRACLVSAELPHVILEKFTHSGIQVWNEKVPEDIHSDAEHVVDIAKRVNPDWIVVDGYGFGFDYQVTIREAGYHLLYIDDYGYMDQYVADIVLNQNMSANEELYKNRCDYTQLLLGPEYVLLRKECQPWASWKKNVSDSATKILVTLGGGDLENITLKVVRALKLLPLTNIEVKIVVGHCNSNLAIIEKELGDAKFRNELLTSVNDMFLLMAWADLAISSGGSTNWEMAFMGLPNLIIVSAENQLGIAQGLHDKQVGINLGWYHHLEPLTIANNLQRMICDQEDRLKRSKNGKDLIDGNGAERVCEKLL